MRSNRVRRGKRTLVVAPPAGTTIGLFVGAAIAAGLTTSITPSNKINWLVGAAAAAGLDMTVTGNNLPTAGWVLDTLTPVAHDSPTHTFFAAAQPGSRIYYIDPSQTVITTALAIDQAADTYFWNGSAIVDSTGSLTGAGGAVYGGDWKNPTGPIKPFKSWSYVAPKESGAENRGNVSTNRIGYVGAASTDFRANKPDMWLFKRATTLDIYSDIRQYLDDTARSATTLWGSSVITTVGGVSSTQRAWIGAYGPASVGLARFISPSYSFIGTNGSASGIVRNQGMFDILLDGSVRDRAVRPVDWAGFTDCDTVMSIGSFGNLNPSTRDFYFEGVVIYQGGASGYLAFSALPTHTTPVGTRGVDFDFSMFRCVVADNWSEKSFVQATGKKAAADPDQTCAANTTTAVTFPTGTTVDFNGTTHTVPAGWAGTSVATSWYGRYWYLLDVTADIAVGGTLRVGLFVNGTEVASKTVTSTAAGSALYKLHGTLYNPETGALGLGIASGAAVQLRLTTTLANSSAVIAGNNQARMVIGRLSYNSLNDTHGVYASLNLGSRYSIQESILLRNGYDNNPVGRVTSTPNGVGRWDFNIRNHNFYTVGDCDLLGCLEIGNVSMVGGAGDVPRNPKRYEGNFNYNGYYSYTPEHNGRPYTTSTGSMNDNVFQVFKVLAGARTITAHPGTGILLSSGVFLQDVKRNIVCDPDGIALYALKVGGVTTPYNVPSQLFWKNDTASNTFDANILIAMATNGNKAVIEEANGENNTFCQWNAPITYNNAKPYPVGTIATCTPTNIPGATYQWNRYTDAINTTTKSPIVGATSSTYTMTSSDIGTAFDTTTAVGWSRIECVVSGGQQPTPTGTENNALTNTVYVRPSGNFDRIYYTMNAFSNVPSSAGGQGAVDTTVPNDSLIAKSSNSFSGFVEAGSASYITTAAAQAAKGGTNWNMSLKVALQGIGLTVNSADGIAEYHDYVVGATPMTTAFQRKNWDGTFLKGIVNAFKTGFGQTPI